MELNYNSKIFICTGMYLENMKKSIKSDAACQSK
uniref:Uncharacterized protein n=1 Tax=Anguilla anguilla TaxID=7936 RepID=A0A0E9VMY5_ANGAN